MAIVLLSAALPSMRAGLAAMLVQFGHVVVDDAASIETGVWVVDAPTRQDFDWWIRRTPPDLPQAVVVLTDDPTTATRLAHLDLHGWACLGRDVSAADLDFAVRAAEAGLALLDLPIAAANMPTVAALADRHDSIGELTARELQVLQLMAEGLPNKGIARRLGIAENTAKFHVAAIKAKLGGSSRTEAVALGVRWGIIVL